MYSSEFAGSPVTQFGKWQQDRNCLERVEAELDRVGWGEAASERYRKNYRKFPSQSGSISLKLQTKMIFKSSQFQIYFLTYPFGLGPMLQLFAFHRMNWRPEWRNTTRIRCDWFDVCTRRSWRRATSKSLSLQSKISQLSRPRVSSRLSEVTSPSRDRQQTSLPESTPSTWGRMLRTGSWVIFPNSSRS